jgi:hypothetical protein
MATKYSGTDYGARELKFWENIIDEAVIFICALEDKKLRVIWTFSHSDCQIRFVQ